MIAYKVVYRPGLGNRQLVSCMIIDRGLKQEYRPGVEVTAKVGGFLCFKLKKQAKQFKRMLGPSCEVWKTEVSNEVVLPRYPLTIGCLFEFAKVLWEDKIASKAPWDYSPPTWPKGTIAFRKVTLRERVG